MAVVPLSLRCLSALQIRLLKIEQIGEPYIDSTPVRSTRYHLYSVRFLGCCDKL